MNNLEIYLKGAIVSVRKSIIKDLLIYDSIHLGEEVVENVLHSTFIPGLGFDVDKLAGYLVSDLQIDYSTVSIIIEHLIEEYRVYVLSIKRGDKNE